MMAVLVVPVAVIMVMILRVMFVIPVDEDVEVDARDAVLQTGLNDQFIFLRIQRCKTPKPFPQQR